MKIKEIKGWSDVSVGQYQEIMSITTENKMTKFIESISIILDCDPEDIRKLSFSEYSELSSKMHFLAQEPDRPMDKIIEIEGKQYGLIPDFNLIDAGTYIDADQFSQDAISNLHYLLALIYRPVISFTDYDDYQIEEHKNEGFEKRANIFRDKVSIEVVLGAVLFFSLKEMNSLQGLVDSLMQEMTK